jgi:hypothetical protein
VVWCGRGSVSWGKGVQVQGASGASTAERHGLENSNPASANSIELHVASHHAQIGFISSHIPLDTRSISFTSFLFQFSCLLDGTRIHRHSQGPHHGGDDFQAVRLLPTQFCAVAHRSALRRELKRRQKQRERDARKAENSANRPPAPNKDSAAEEAENEEDLSPNVRWSY